MQISFLTLADITAIHKNQIDLYGGAIGLRDANLLHSALAQPGAVFGGQYLHEDLFQMAAAYLFHITGNHPFVDGNKRTAIASTLVFLDLNGYDIDTSDEELWSFVIRVSTEVVSKRHIAEWLQERAHPHDIPPS